MRMLIVISLAVALVGVSQPTAAAHGPTHSGPVVTTTHTDFLDPAARLRPGRPVAAGAAASRALATAWCGSAGGPDDGGAAPSISLVYAVPSDQPNRFRQTAGILQPAATAIGRFVALESGGSKTIRFETGTSCGPEYLRIAFVRLGQPRVAYLDSNGAPVMPLVRDEVERALPAPAGPRNRLVYVDGLVDEAAGYAEVVDADEPGPGNPHNAGGLFAFVWGAREAPSRRDVPSYAYLMLHEVTHNLGGVQRSAPHTSGAWHCTDEFDVMCYDDGGTPQRQKIACRARSGMLVGAYDCNQDDYFNPSPAPGSYLASHLNVYDSAFLGSCRELRAACGQSRQKRVRMTKLAPRPARRSAGPGHE
jgi:hypothetical protein